MAAPSRPATGRRRRTRGRDERRRAFRYGLLSELLCRLILRVKGYRILATRLRTRVGEIDILAERRSTLAIIEVKARHSLAEALYAVPPVQRRRLERAALSVQQADPRLQGHALRFDLFAVAHWRIPRHIQNAWYSDFRK